MAKSKLQIHLEYLIARLLLAVFGVLPLRVALFVGSKMGRAAYYFSGRLRRTGERNLELAFPDLDQHERRRWLRGCFENLGRLLGIFSQFTAASPQTLQLLIESEGLEHLEAAIKRRRGVILFTGHVGAWELSSFALSLFGYPLSFLVRRIDNPKLEALVDHARRRPRHAGDVCAIQRGVVPDRRRAAGADAGAGHGDYRHGRGPASGDGLQRGRLLRR